MNANCQSNSTLNGKFLSTEPVLAETVHLQISIYPWIQRLLSLEDYSIKHLWQMILEGARLSPDNYSPRQEDGIQILMVETFISL